MRIFKKIDLKKNSTFFSQSCSAMFLLQTVQHLDQSFFSTHVDCVLRAENVGVEDEAVLVLLHLGDLLGLVVGRAVVVDYANA